MLHVVGWFLITIQVLMLVVGGRNNAVFDLANIPGFGWLVALGSMQVLARRRNEVRLATVDMFATPTLEAQDQEGVNQGIAHVFNGLDERQRMVMALYYFDGLTMHQIGEVFGVSEGRVRQLHMKAISQLRSRVDDPGIQIDEYLSRRRRASRAGRVRSVLVYTVQPWKVRHSIAVLRGR